ncbi:competence/damage-inducible protein A [Halobacteriales archaeon QS_3_64_16]|nr:MAG: competence/damage-inducible protein A [Halobacteriales archaeon QS_3_64_16]
MRAALLTIGDELLAGDTENTNASWLAAQLTSRGVTTKRILVIPDEIELIARKTREYAEEFDAVILTGGLGGTHDDLTMAAVARAFDRELEVDELARTDVEETLEGVRERLPDLDIDVAAHAAIPAGGRPLLNGEGLAPGCVIENVYVLPGIPREMKPMFESVVEEFSGTARSRVVYTTTPEGEYTKMLTEARDRFDVSVGSYPSRSEGQRRNRIKILGEDEARLAEAADWIEARVDPYEGEEVED